MNTRHLCRTLHLTVAGQASRDYVETPEGHTGEWGLDAPLLPLVCSSGVFVYVMGSYINLEGKVFGKWTVIERVPRASIQAHFLCRCECGQEGVVSSGNLRNGASKSCGCAKPTNPRFKDLTGQRVGKWLVLERGPNAGYYTRWLCQCECGTMKLVWATHLLKGKTQSCNCGSHGMTGTPEYYAWRSMKNRCLNENDSSFPNYGGRGIYVCDEWAKSFLAFYKHVGPRPSEGHSLDRLDTNGHYVPGNVRWATRSEQNSNKRSTVYVTFRGQTKTVMSWAKEMSLSPDTVRRRLKKGWPPERALTQPSRFG